MTLQLEQVERPAAARIVEETDCCIVGAGPAGAILALILARRGIRTTLLEAMLDFERDFRGDTLMPSTLELVDQLGLSEQVHALPHARMPEMRMNTASGSEAYIDLTQVKTRFPYIMMVPQARFLEVVTEEAKRLPNFRLVMGARVKELVEEDGVVRGVVYATPDGPHQVKAKVTIGADGRFSKVRQLAGLELVRNDEPLDMLWLRVRNAGSGGRPGLYTLPGMGYVVVVARGPQWQIGFALPKGRYKQLSAAGLGSLREAIATLVPWLAEDIQDLQDWKQTSMLSIESGRARRWFRPGLLLIGDAAHVMSPVGGVGINSAIQDPIAAANAFAGKLRDGNIDTADLARVQRSREWQVRITQACQRSMQRNVMSGTTGVRGAVFRSPIGRRVLSRVLALGVRRLRLESLTNA